MYTKCTLRSAPGQSCRWMADTDAGQWHTPTKVQCESIALAQHCTSKAGLWRGVSLLGVRCVPLSFSAPGTYCESSEAAALANVCPNATARPNRCALGAHLTASDKACSTAHTHAQHNRATPARQPHKSTSVPLQTADTKLAQCWQGHRACPLLLRGPRACCELPCMAVAKRLACMGHSLLDSL